MVHSAQTLIRHPPLPLSSTHALSFPKESLHARVGVTSVPTSADSDPGLSDDASDARPHSPPPVSLLTTLLSDHMPRVSTPETATSSTQSSPPQTEISSPAGPQLGIVQQVHPNTTPAPILRRGSMSASPDPGHETVAFGRLTEINPLGKSDNAMPQEQHRPCALKFAIAPHPHHPPPPECTSNPPPVKRLRSPLAQERALQGNLEDHEEYEAEPSDDGSASYTEVLPGYPRLPSKNALPTKNDSEESDPGYQEDEEDGTFSDDDLYSSDIPKYPARYPFARPTGYKRGPESDAPSAPSVLPPPARRGRGHIKVADPPLPQRACSRHCSPPPSRSRSGSDGRDIKRPGIPGPRGRRAGSPMPAVFAVDSEDEADEDDDTGLVDAKPDSTSIPSGWRSDDALFVRPQISSRRLSASHSVGDAQIEETLGANGPGLMGTIFRRASEHIPGFRRPWVTPMPEPQAASAGAIPVQVLCPPALDNTPAMARSLSRHEIGESSGGLTHRLEQTLSAAQSDGAGSTRARSLGSEPILDAGVPVRAVISEAESPSRPRRARPREQMRPIERRGSRRGDDLGWTDDAILRIRRNLDCEE